ncbi:GntR family transcriptional regulator [Streptosporangium roseum]|uniref:GntR family transcriptional regulator n=1 Tax=Streptosporangium roseum TaxID=2001 RepID=UPI0009DDED2E|nr:winged helix-turn-helix domain-containing protein [Streptosporangium roseum]
MEKLSPRGDADRHASKKLAAVLRTDIEEGRYGPGTRLPSYRQLAERHGVVVNTAQAAVRLLQAEGRVTIRPGSGTVVRAEPDALPEDLRSDLEEVRGRLRQTQEVLSATEKAVTALLGRLPAEASVEARQELGNAG